MKETKRYVKEEKRAYHLYRPVDFRRLQRCPSIVSLDSRTDDYTNVCLTHADKVWDGGRHVVETVNEATSDSIKGKEGPRRLSAAGSRFDLRERRDARETDRAER